MVALRELKGFRHVIRHAYDLSLRPERLHELATMAESTTDRFAGWMDSFLRAVRAEQGW